MAVGFEASDLFDMAASFQAQGSSSIDMDDPANILDSVGNNECETMINGRTEYSNSFAYCSTTPALASDLGTALTQFGDVFDAKKMTGMTIGFAAGQYATVDVDGHQHDAAAHTSAVTEGYCDATAATIAGAGFGVPTWTGQVDGTDAAAVSATLTLTANHVDEIGADGAHFAGNSITFRAELTVEWVGVPTTPTPTGWTQDSYGPADSSTGFDRSTWTGHRFFDRAT